MQGTSLSTNTGLCAILCKPYEARSSISRSHKLKKRTVAAALRRQIENQRPPQTQRPAGATGCGWLQRHACSLQAAADSALLFADADTPPVPWIRRAIDGAPTQPRYTFTTAHDKR